MRRGKETEEVICGGLYSPYERGEKVSTKTIMGIQKRCLRNKIMFTIPVEMVEEGADTSQKHKDEWTSKPKKH